MLQALCERIPFRLLNLHLGLCAALAIPLHAQDVDDAQVAVNLVELMPRNTAFYVELNAETSGLSLLRDSPGLAALQVAFEETEIAPVFKDSVLELKGMACGLVSLSHKRAPSFYVYVFKASSSENCRAVLDMLRENGAVHTRSIEGDTALRVERRLLVVHTGTFLLASWSRPAVETLHGRLHGNLRPGLPESAGFAGVARDHAREALFFYSRVDHFRSWCVGAVQAVLPFGRSISKQGLLLLDSLRNVSGHLRLEQGLPSVVATFQLREDHASPGPIAPLSKERLKGLPPGVSFLLAGTLTSEHTGNEGLMDPAPVPDSFDSLVAATMAMSQDIAIYGLDRMEILPLGGVSMTTLDLPRLTELWMGVFERMSLDASRHIEPVDRKTVKLRGKAVERFRIGPIQFFVHAQDNELLVSSGRRAMYILMRGRKRGSSIYDDEVLGPGLTSLSPPGSTLMVFSPSRLARQLEAYIPIRVMDRVKALLPTLEPTSIAMSLRKEGDQWSLEGRLTGFPSIAEFASILKTLPPVRADSPGKFAGPVGWSSDR